jgi:polyphosphate glucokinase
MTHILGIDIGGSGIKGALVDLEKGAFATDRLRIDTPQPATPDAVIGTIKEIVSHFNYTGPLGVGIPSVVLNGTVMSAANIDDGWIGYPGQTAIAKATGCQTLLLNDGDVAGVAEMRYGAGKGHNGIVMIFTLGTGVGSVMFVNGKLVPNLELGHLYLRHMKADAENHMSARVREEQDLGWKKWGKRLNTYFQHIEMLFSPDLIIIGGGVSKKHDSFLHYIDVRAEVVPAKLRNEAGIVGAAVTAVEAFSA